ncbi:MAG: alpha-L-arabinofuranosidase C-terminal domain-containing protein [Phycisphaerales bacterium]
MVIASFVVSCVSAVAAALPTSVPVGPLVVHVDRPGHAISPRLEGIFFEEINHAGEGGLLAELVRNRSFDESGDGVPGWSARGGATIAREPSAMRLRGSAMNDGFPNGSSVIAVTSGQRYALRVDARRDGEATLRVALERGDGTVLASADVGPLSDRLARFDAMLVPSATANDAKLVVTSGGKGAAVLDVVSLIPADTWKSHGLRTDLAEMVAALRPTFVRFPGGCYVEGGDLLKDAFRWPKTVGDIAQRPGHMNANWGYWSTDGLGYHEYLQWCEDLGADALYVVNCGMSHKENVPLDHLQPWVQEALDAIEYANGDATTPMGALRAKHGHPAPFRLKYIEIGNENGMFGGFGGTFEQYTDRYKRFEAAIKAKYPSIQTIANVRVPAPFDIIDDHYYNSPGWFWANVGLYDGADRKGPKIYVGEYAVTQQCGTGNLRAALAEAAFLTGLERNSDIVAMASYAPLFVHTKDRRWNPDAIVFDNHRAYGTPSYWVQAMNAEHRADTIVPVSLPQLPEPRSVGSIGVGTWFTEAEFKDIVVTVPSAAGDRVVYRSDFTKGAPGWRAMEGAWKVVDGAYRCNERAEKRFALLDMPELRDASDYVVSMKARKLAGDEGFLVLVHAPDADNYTWWNVGGWGNHTHAIERSVAGSKSGVGRGAPGGVETNRWYDVRVECRDGRLRCFLDGKEIHDERDSAAPQFVASAGRATATGDLIVKVVNGTEADVEVPLEFPGAALRDGTATTLTSARLDDENSFDAPRAVAPARSAVRASGSTLTYRFSARSYVILRLPSTAATTP